MDKELKTGVELIADERKRQVEVEGWTKKHDATHWRGELWKAAICYAMGDQTFHKRFSNADGDVAVRIEMWPWQNRWWKPSDDKIRNLVKAGALIAAEIDRLQNTKQ